VALLNSATLNLRRGKFFYGWYIVGTGFLANIASSFALASTLSIFLKPLTAELGISRGVFSLLRSGEGVIGALVAPFVGTLVDRHGGRWLIVIGPPSLLWATSSWAMWKLSRNLSSFA
jgi:Na+/melibiose symporter-like transporter